MFEEHDHTTKRVRRSEAFASSLSPTSTLSVTPTSSAAGDDGCGGGGPGTSSRRGRGHGHRISGSGSRSGSEELESESESECDGDTPSSMIFEYKEKDLRHGPQQEEGPEQGIPFPSGDDNADSQTFSFRLFSSHARPRADGDGDGEGEDDSSLKRSDGGVARVNIRSPTPPSAGAGGGGFLVPSRGPGYYFTRDTAGREKKRSEYADVALEGWEVVGWARSTSWPGASLPWRVIQGSVPAAGLATSLKVGPASSNALERKRPRAGKKRRIAIRRKHVLEARAAETERDKRTRRNREKKLKKREKNRLMKQRQAGKESIEAPT